jgi:aminoglycoside phosphotransferase (APT) family kinase protein
VGWLDVYGSHTVGADRIDPSSPAAATPRLHQIRDGLPIDLGASPRWVESAVNDVWRVGDLFLRVCYRGDRSRFEREALLLAALPASIPRPEVFAVGETDGLPWMITHALPGAALRDIAFGAPTSEATLRAPVEEMADMLRSLHEWVPPPAVLEALEAKEARVDAADALGIVAADTVALPLVRALALVEPLQSLPHVDNGLIAAAVDRLSSLRAHDTVSTAPRRVLHGDAYLTNVLVADGRITGLIDFEFARLGPRDLELISFIRALDVERLVGAPPPPILRWIEDAYPELFAHPHLHERLWLYGLASAMHFVLFWPPDRPEGAGLHPAHPLHHLRRLIDAPLPLDR